MGRSLGPSCALLYVAACAAEEPDPAPTFKRDIAPLIDEHCVPCHSGELPSGELDLSGRLHAAIVGAPAIQADLLLVESGDHLYSYLWHKMNGSQALAGGAGSRMPLGEPLPDALVNKVADWIDAGARRRD